MITHLSNLLDEDVKTRDGAAGETYESYGGHRALGAVYAKLPAGLGGDSAKALRYLETAFTKGGNYTLNAIYYAEVLFATGDKVKARQTLDDLLKNDPKTYNPNRIPETIDEFVEAARIRKTMGN